MNRKEKLFNFIKDNRETPFSYNEIVIMLDIKEPDLSELDTLLSELLSEKKIILTKKKRYKYNKENDYFEGVFIGNDRGFGFIKSEDYKDDFFVAPENKKDALNKDRVKFKIISEGDKDRRASAVVVEIVERNNSFVVGTFVKSRNFGFVIADDKKLAKDIFISKKNDLSARDGEKVVCKIINFGNKTKKPEGVITEVIGFFDIGGNDMISVIKKYDLPVEFPCEVIREAKNKSSEYFDYENRIDLRDKLVITIDGEDAKDLDDAISLKKTGDYYILGVHIADVSHYVEEKSHLDKEAYKRGTSVYLADRVIPMLPKELSNGICSLHPGVDRLTVSAFMTIDKKGKVISCEFKRSVINSKHRMTYTEVTDILENNKSCDKKLKTLLVNMKELALILRRKRKNRGSLDFDFPECKIIYDKNNFPVDIQKYEMSISNYIIEEFMLIANETVAEYVFWQNKPFIYRIHEQPDPDKMDKFKILIKNMGYSLKGSSGEIHPKALLDLLEKIKGDKAERIIQTIMLRSLMKARYSPENKGHFGLSSKYYCHFTSPIRRYPDLIVHRLLKLLMDGTYDDNTAERYMAYVERASLYTSEREEVAENAERETKDIKKAVYMKKRIGEWFEGVISSVTNFGLFVELDNTVEGLIRYENINDDYYNFDDKMYVATGERTGKKFTIGDRVVVEIEDANPQLMEIDFRLIKKI